MRRTTGSEIDRLSIFSWEVFVKCRQSFDFTRQSWTEGREGDRLGQRIRELREASIGRRKSLPTDAVCIERITAESSEALEMCLS